MIIPITLSTNNHIFPSLPFFTSSPPYPIFLISIPKYFAIGFLYLLFGRYPPTIRYKYPQDIPISFARSVCVIPRSVNAFFTATPNGSVLIFITLTPFIRFTYLRIFHLLIRNQEFKFIILYVKMFYIGYIFISSCVYYTIIFGFCKYEIRNKSNF